MPNKSIITLNSIKKKATLDYKPFSLPPNPPLQQHIEKFHFIINITCIFCLYLVMRPM
jgi:hypothetical protein